MKTKRTRLEKTAARVALMLALLLACAATGRADAVDDYVQMQMKQQHIPGLSLAVLRDGKVVKAKGYGLANVASNESATPETVYRIGSISKQFIASAIMLLNRDRRLNIEDSITKYLDGAPAFWNPITIRHLLTHTSGLIREAPAFDALKLQPDADVIRSAYSAPLVFSPGASWQYSNVGYYILAEIVRKTTRGPWGDFITERIFRPAGMRETTVTTTSDAIKNRASGYAWSVDKWSEAPPITTLRPSGAFLSTVLDLAKWDAALYKDGILSQAIRDQMWQSVKLANGRTYPYGFGWQIGTVAGEKVVSHGGAGWGFISEIYRFLDSKLTVIVLTNIDRADASLISRHIAELYRLDTAPTPPANLRTKGVVTLSPPQSL